MKIKKITPDKNKMSGVIQFFKKIFYAEVFLKNPFMGLIQIPLSNHE